MTELPEKKVILGISGSIAAYKGADIASKLTQKQVSVFTVMTKNATKLIAPLTFQSITKNFVQIDVMQEKDASKIAHIHLTELIDAFVIAPATANIIGKIANGIADDMLSTQALTLSRDLPKFFAPAMNTRMYENFAVQKNMRILEENGWTQIEPKKSWLACGEEGKGALADVSEIVAQVLRAIGK
jgi:phosphopantothenoylcysteine decarboxylase